MHSEPCNTSHWTLHSCHSSDGRQSPCGASVNHQVQLWHERLLPARTVHLPGGHGWKLLQVPWARHDGPGVCTVLSIFLYLVTTFLPAVEMYFIFIQLKTLLRFWNWRVNITFQSGQIIWGAEQWGELQMPPLSLQWQLNLYWISL